MVIGRDEELRVLREALAAARGGRGWAIFLSGEDIGLSPDGAAVYVTGSSFDEDPTISNVPAAGSSTGNAWCRMGSTWTRSTARALRGLLPRP